MAEEIKEEILEEIIDEEEAAAEENPSTEAAEAEALESDGKKDKKKKKEKKDRKDEQIAELNDRVMRQMAEFENFRRRTEKEKAQMFEVGAKSIVEKILPVVDNFERGLAGTEESDDPFTQGMLMIYKQLQTCLEEAGVAPIPAVGSEFNPELHNAVMHIDDEEFPENTVIEEFQKGYTYRDSVVRHSMVKVAN